MILFFQKDYYDFIFSKRLLHFTKVKYKKIIFFQNVIYEIEMFKYKKNYFFSKCY